MTEELKILARRVVDDCAARNVQSWECHGWPKGDPCVTSRLSPDSDPDPIILIEEGIEDSQALEFACWAVRAAPQIAAAYLAQADHFAALRAEVASLTQALAEAEALKTQHGAVIDQLSLECDAVKAGYLKAGYGVIEREVWKAMVWAAKQPPPPGDVYPPYTDSGNSHAEVECRRATYHILAALEPDTDGLALKGGAA